MKKKSFVGWTRKNWLQDFKEHDITRRIIHHEIHRTKSSYIVFGGVSYYPIKVRITIEQLSR